MRYDCGSRHSLLVLAAPTSPVLIALKAHHISPQPGGNAPGLHGPDHIIIRDGGRWVKVGPVDGGFNNGCSGGGGGGIAPRGGAPG